MPFNFVKALSTESPQIAVNQLVEDEFTTQMIGSAAEAIKTMAEDASEKADAASVGNFNNDLATLQAGIDDLADMSNLQRLDASRRAWEAQRDEDTSNDEKARKMFAQELEAINYREEQQGIVLESNKRALIRKWMSIRPDLTPAFQKTLATNKAIYELDRMGPKTDARYAKYREMEQVAQQNGIPIEILQRQEVQSRYAKEVTDQVNFRVQAGKAKKDDFFIALTPRIDQASTALQALMAQQAEGVRRGDVTGMRAIEAAKEQMLIQKKELLWAIEIERRSFNVQNNVDVDTTDVVAHVDNLFETYIDNFTTDAARNILAGVDAAKEDSQAAYLAAWIKSRAPGMFYDLDLAQVPRLSFKIATPIIEGMMNLSKDGGLIDKLRTGKFGIMTGLARVDLPTAIEMGSVAPLLYNLSQTPQAGQLNSDQKMVLEEAYRALSMGALPTPEVAAKASPIIVQLLLALEKDPRLSADEKKNIDNYVKADAWKGFGGPWDGINILNEKSGAVARIRRESDASFNANFRDNVEVKLEPYYQAALDKAQIKNVKLDPVAATRPFYIQTTKEYATMNDLERREYTIAKNLADIMNDAYTVRVNGRGVQDAKAWAKSYYDNLFTPPELEAEPSAPKPQPPVTSNTSKIEVTDEKVRAFIKLEEELKTGKMTVDEYNRRVDEILKD